MADEEKLFERREAERLLPTIEPLLETARESKLQAEAIEEEFSAIHQRILLQGGLVPRYGHLAEQKLERDRLEEEIQNTIARIEQNGCLVKDLGQGLVDFPTRRENEIVYLCWKLGEDRIRYWHRTDEGFGGRKPLDADAPRPPEPPRPS